MRSPPSTYPYALNNPFSVTGSPVHCRLENGTSVRRQSTRRPVDALSTGYMASSQSIPTWLETPPSIASLLPVTPLAASLPVNALEWADFERLCLRLARSEGEVLSARLYGTAGQAQEGIDLFAQVRDAETYRVYQCKRTLEFSPAVIRRAVETFLSGSWAERAHSLVLCTSDSVRTTNRIEEIEQQRKLLTVRGIAFEVWAQEDISEKLRSQPAIVFEFFGAAWLEHFCGSGALALLHAARTRLGPPEIGQLRRELRRLYGNIFAAIDPGLSVAHQESPLLLYDRYVVPDLIERSTLGDAPSENALDKRAPASDDFTPFGEPGELRHLSESRPRSVSGRRQAAGRRARGASLSRPRTSIGAFFSTAVGGKFVLLGGPGSGKSALLRYLALDLLSEEPRIKELSSVWGRHLPIWVPFSAWVEATDRAGRPVALSEALRQWLEVWDEGVLWPLVENALDDRRLLILVDGLDEWTSEAAARVAITQLSVFAAQRDVPVVLTSRPHGFQRLSTEFVGWHTADIAPLSHAQQAAVARTWFRNWLDADNDLTADSVARDGRLASSISAGVALLKALGDTARGA
jgi:NACHT domain/Restriction endonuclease